MTANIARGEVDVEIGGEPYVLVATFETFGKVQSKLGVRGLDAVNEKINTVDPDILIDVVRCMALTGDAEKMKKAPFNVPTLLRLRKAIMDALNGPEDEIKNVVGAAAASQT